LSKRVALDSSSKCDSPRGRPEVKRSDCPALRAGSDAVGTRGTAALAALQVGSTARPTSPGHRDAVPLAQCHAVRMRRGHRVVTHRRSAGCTCPVPHRPGGRDCMCPSEPLYPEVASGPASRRRAVVVRHRRLSETPAAEKARGSPGALWQRG